MSPEAPIGDISCRRSAHAVRRALSIKARHGLSYWDSAIVAAACAQGCGELWTEDLAHGLQIEGVTVVNPFR
jgi:predicted nucleic acid-binding protein